MCDFAQSQWAGYGGYRPKSDDNHDVLVDIGCGISKSRYRYVLFFQVILLSNVDCHLFRAKREHPFSLLALGIMLFTCLSAGLASTWALLFLFDLIVFGMTLYKTLTYSRSNPNMLTTVLMRDGE